jgi:DNA mismatch repair protein MutS2
MDTEFHSLLAELKEKRRHQEELLADLVKREQRLEQQERLIAEQLAAGEQHKRDTMEKAYLEAREVIATAKRETRNLLEEARREKNRTPLKKLEEAEKTVGQKLRDFETEPPLSIDEIKEGDAVFVRSIGYDAVVLKIDKRQNRLRVKAGSMDMEVPISDIARKKGKAAGPAKKGRRSVQAEEPVAIELKLLGLRVDDALTRLEKFLNHASLDGRKEVRVIHGIGTGALLAAVREHLAGHPLVSDFRAGEQYEGGNGATVVTLR